MAPRGNETLTWSRGQGRTRSEARKGDVLLYRINGRDGDYSVAQYVAADQPQVIAKEVGFLWLAEALAGAHYQRVRQ